MLPFLKMPIVLMPQDEKEAERDVEAHVQPIDVEHFYPGYYWGTIIHMKTGALIVTRMTVEQVAQGLAHYWAQLQAQQQKEASKQSLLLQ
jgi:hypothetical protein